MGAGRTASGLPLTRLRVARGLLEIGAPELRFTDTEAADLLASSGVDAASVGVVRLNERCEG